MTFRLLVFILAYRIEDVLPILNSNSYWTILFEAHDKRYKYLNIEFRSTCYRKKVTQNIPFVMLTHGFSFVGLHFGVWMDGDLLNLNSNVCWTILIAVHPIYGKNILMLNSVPPVAGKALNRLLCWQFLMLILLSQLVTCF